MVMVIEEKSGAMFGCMKKDEKYCANAHGHDASKCSATSQSF